MAKKLGLFFLALSCALVAPAHARTRIVLTFDDGPSNDHTRLLGGKTPSQAVLDVLKAREIKAAFFVLTGPDRWPDLAIGGVTYPKAETALGFATLRREAREGHLLACHWGGTYGAQPRLHPSRLSLPAYDSTGDGMVDRVSLPGNALESDLLQTRSRILEAYRMEGRRHESVDFVRPPLWVYSNEAGDARPTYEALGLKLVLTDAKLSDGGYIDAGFQRPRNMYGEIDAALAAGEQDIVITMHDSNALTARHLDAYLTGLEAHLAKKGMLRGRDWSFPSNAAEIREALMMKARFLLFPKR